MNVNNLHWTESTIENIVVDGRSIEIIASQVLLPHDPVPRRVRVVFENVASSKREVSEYIGNVKAPAGFFKHTVYDLSTETSDSETTTFCIEGVTSFAPVAWIDWTIEATRAQVFLL